MTKLERYVEIFKIPPAIVPYVQLAVTEKEMDLVIGLADGQMTVDEIAATLAVPLEEANELVRQAVSRKVITIAGRTSWRQPIEEMEKPLRYAAATQPLAASTQVSTKPGLGSTMWRNGIRISVSSAASVCNAATLTPFSRTSMVKFSSTPTSAGAAVSVPPAAQKGRSRWSS
jgi:hypothetical protein